jgi:serine/threonine-protein kinase HipA
VERAKLFRTTIFSFLVGNEDMHLKNFSLITRGQKTELSPAYDLLNSTLVLGDATKEEMALPICGKRSKLNRVDLLEYFPQYLKLSGRLVAETLNTFRVILPEWKKLISASFLKEESKKEYLQLVERRIARLQLG